MIKITDTTKCCGCSSCAAACPQNCIMITMDEEGFYYPQINESQCVDCGICELKCPIINCKKEEPHKQNSYVVQNKDNDILKESTSGGAFTPLAKYIIEQNGVVVGAAMNEDLTVSHVIVNDVKDLYKFRNSKYVQSFISPNIFREVKNYLKENVMVCFSGTICQIEGLKSFLSDINQENLYCVDVVCRAVPSPHIFKKYIDFQSHNNNASVTKLRFRDKFYGYRFPSVNIGFNNNQSNYHRGIESDPWLRAFFTGICNRPSCHSCSFKKQYRISDITLWDCFDYEDRFPNMSPNMGASNVLIQSSKGQQLFDKVYESFFVEPVETNIQISRIKEMTQSTPLNSQRSQFFRDAKVLGGYELFEKYFHIGFKQQLLYYGRLLALKSGLYKIAKKILR